MIEKKIASQVVISKGFKTFRVGGTSWGFNSKKLID